MDTVDSSIPLAANTQGLDIGKMMTLASMAQEMRQRQTQIQSQNALTQTLANPQSYDASGNINPNALRAVTAANPDIGLKMKEQSIEEKLRQAQEAHYQSEQGKAQFDFMSGIAGVGMDAYTEAKKTGKSEADAIAAGKQATNDAAKASGGMLSEQQMQGIMSHPFDPVQVKAFASMNKDWIAGNRASQVAELGVKKEDLAERRQNDVEKQNAERDRILLETLKNKESGGGDPKKEAFQTFMKEHPNATAEEQARFIQSSGGSMRSPLTMATQKFIEEHAEDHGGRGPTADELSRFYAGMRATAAETVQVSKREGNIASSATALTEKGGLYDQLDEAASKVNLGDSKTVNWIREGLQRHVYANPDIQRYVTVLEDTRADLTNVLARTGQATETVRAQAAHMFPETMSLAELRTAVDASKKVTAAVMSGNEKVMEALKSGKSILEAAGLADVNKKNEAAADAKAGKAKSEIPPDIQAILDKHGAS
jgi:hypothetical protein